MPKPSRSKVSPMHNIVAVFAAAAALTALIVAATTHAHHIAALAATLAAGATEWLAIDLFLGDHDD